MDPAHHDLVLARAIAGEIRRLCDPEAGETLPLPQKGGQPRRRRLSPGDFLVLVQRRSTLFAELIRACKAEGLPIAGADRLRLGAELAVKDLAALLSFLATPEDDLSLAAVLKSPLFGWSEDRLFRLAHGRDGYLWTALRAAKAPRTLEVLDDLRDAADFLRPYEILERVLTRHDGRRKLLARLGPEAEDGIDALLAQAMAYESSEVPSLTGFLSWMETEDVEVKRQLATAEGVVRVMTVHGAKGLEAPIVILPDTAKRRVDVREKIFDANGPQLWAGAKDDMPEPMLELRDGLIGAQERERRRLLYVAMTRAESWLIICAAGDVGDGGDSWHAMAAEGLERAGAVTAPMPGGDGLRYAHLDWRCGDLKDGRVAPTALPPAPSYPAVPTPALLDGTLSPSDLGGAKVLPGDPAGGDLEQALARGTLMHLLLEHLPALPEDQRRPQGRRLLANAEEAELLDDTETLLDDALRVIGAPGLETAFAAEALVEVDITAALPKLGDRRLHGAIDRLLVEDDQIVAIDFKTNRLVPERPEDVPEGILRQMGAYAAMLAQLWPDRRIETAILWTAEARLMPLPETLVMAALRRAASA